MRRLTAVLAVSILLALPACGDEEPRGARVSAATETATPEASPTEAQKGRLAPPPIQLETHGGETIDAYQSSFCWNSLCADSYPHDKNLPDVGSPEAVDFAFPTPDTHFSAVFFPVHDGCVPTYVGRVTELGDGRYSLAPAGPPDRYKVLLTGHASLGGAPGMFFWTTPVAGDSGEPRAEISVVRRPHGKIEPAYVVLDLRELARTPQEASAKVRVTADNGASMAFDFGKPELGCPESGYVSFWRVGKQVGRKVAALGPEPFRYDVELVMDGTTYSAGATWPDDHVPNPETNDPALVPLVFDPPLPARG